MKYKILFFAIFLIYSCNNKNLISEDSEITKYDEIVNDIDGNQYNTVKIGEKIWLASNLKTTKFSNGDKIPNLKDDKSWINTEGPAYCLFDNSITNFEFGSLYNLMAIIDKRNVCPQGWHVPSLKEWEKWEGTRWNNWDANMKKLFNNKILGWRDISDTHRKNTKFSSFYSETEFDNGDCIYWTSTSYMDENYDTKNSKDSIMSGNITSSGELGTGNWGLKNQGYSCRCVKDTIKK